MNDYKRVKFMNIIIKEKSISSTKQEFPSVFRQALKGFEIITGNQKSNDNETVSIISTKIFEDIIDKAYKFNPVIEPDEDGLGYTVALDEVMVFGDGDTLEEALYDLADNLIEYAMLYLEKMDFYMQIENRKDHYPYLRKIAKCANKEEALEVILECRTDLQQEILKK